MKCTNSHSRGFTLVELVVTMVLIGILAAVAVPRMFDSNVFVSRGFYDEVVNAARYGQKLAVASGCNVEFSIAGGRYELHQAATCSGGPPYNQPVPEPAGSDPFAAAAPAGVILASIPASPIVFDSLGRASGNFIVTVGDRSFTIAGESGYVGGL